MKNYVTFLLALMPVVSCSMFETAESGNGELSIHFATDFGAQFKSSAPAMSIPDTNDFILSVVDSKGKTVYEGPYGAAPEVMPAAPGTYQVSVRSCVFREPLYDCPQFGDDRQAVVNAGGRTSVSLDCCQVNSGVRLRITNDFLKAYPDAVLFLKSHDGKLMYGYTETRTAYFNPGSVSLVMFDSNVDRTLFTRVLAPRQILSVSVSPGSGEGAGTEDGGGMNISVDTSRVWTWEDCRLGNLEKGSEPASAFGVSQVPSIVGETGVWVCGYIVGGDLTSSKCSFNAPFSSRTNIVLASKSSCTDKSACISVQLSKGDIRDALNLVDHEENKGRQVFIKGDVVASYYGITGMQNLSDYMFK